jgi:hemerythrin-like domain-containing protein
MTPLFPSPSADFDHPIDILDGCHERILRSCALVEGIAGHIVEKGVDAEARTAAVNVMRYFDTAGANHHRDEEEDLFPALQQHVPSKELNAVFALLHRLRADHKKLEALWKAMRKRLAATVEGRDAGLTPKAAGEFKAAYESHIALEEAELLPLARRVLAPEIIAALGGRMARRRGVKNRGRTPL